MKLKAILCRWIAHDWDVVYVRSSKSRDVLTLVDKCGRCGVVRDHRDDRDIPMHRKIDLAKCVLR